MYAISIFILQKKTEFFSGIFHPGNSKKRRTHYFFCLSKNFLWQLANTYATDKILMKEYLWNFSRKKNQIAHLPTDN